MGLEGNNDPTKCYYHITPTDPDEMARILIKAFHEGAIVVIDELNSLPLERLMNQLLSGVDPDGKEAKVKGCLFICTQNPATFTARQRLSSALENRFRKIPLNDYPENELKEIARQACPNHSVEAEKLVDEFMIAKRYADKHNKVPGPSPRNLFTEFSKLAPGSVGKDLNQTQDRQLEEEVPISGFWSRVRVDEISNSESHRQRGGNSHDFKHENTEETSSDEEEPIHSFWGKVRIDEEEVKFQDEKQTKKSIDILAIKSVIREELIQFKNQNVNTKGDKLANELIKQIQSVNNLDESRALVEIKDILSKNARLLSQELYRSEKMFSNKKSSSSIKLGEKLCEIINKIAPMIGTDHQFQRYK